MSLLSGFEREFSAGRGDENSITQIRMLLRKALVAEKRVAFLIRIPAELKSNLEAMARREHRSLNQQIEHLLTKASVGRNEPEGTCEPKRGQGRE